jgi:hypothetical protein
MFGGWIALLGDPNKRILGMGGDYGKAYSNAGGNGEWQNATSDGWLLTPSTGHYVSVIDNAALAVPPTGNNGGRGQFGYVAFQNDIWVLGGVSNNVGPIPNLTSTAWFDGSAWHNGPSLPRAHDYSGSTACNAAVYGGTPYFVCVGGIDDQSPDGPVAGNHSWMASGQSILYLGGTAASHYTDGAFYGVDIPAETIYNAPSFVGGREGGGAALSSGRVVSCGGRLLFGNAKDYPFSNTCITFTLNPANPSSATQWALSAAMPAVPGEDDDVGASPNNGRAWHGHGATSDGRVVLFGGIYSQYLVHRFSPRRSILLYDPASNTFTVAGSLQLPRSGPVVIPDPRATDAWYVVSGQSSGGFTTPTVERCVLSGAMVSCAFDGALPSFPYSFNGQVWNTTYQTTGGSAGGVLADGQTLYFAGGIEQDPNNCLPSASCSWAGSPHAVYLRPPTGDVTADAPPRDASAECYFTAIQELGEGNYTSCSVDADCGGGCMQCKGNKCVATVK